MIYKKIMDGDYIAAVFTSDKQTEGGIPKAEYDEILLTIRNKPTPPAGYGYRLKADLTWELYELPPEDPDPELTAEEALSVIMGGNA